MTDLTITIVSYNTKELLKKCLESILNKKWQNTIKIWVIDNASHDGSPEMVKKDFPNVHLINSGANLGFAGGHNLALKKAESSFYLLLNSDAEIVSESLDKWIDEAKINNFAVSGCKLINPDGSLQPSAGDIPFGIALYSWLFGLDDLPFLKKILPSFHQTSPDFYTGAKKVGWISGAAFMISKNALDTIGLLDDNIFMYCEDVDYCIRAQKKNLTVGLVGKVTIRHVGGASSDDPRLRQWTGEFKQLIYLHKKYQGILSAALLKITIYFAIILRIFAFTFMGKPKYSQTYVKILLAI